MLLHTNTNGYCVQKKVLNTSFKISDAQKKIIRFVLKTFNMYLESKKIPHTQHFLALNNFWNNQMLKYTLCNCLISSVNLERGDIAFEFDAW